MAALCWLSAGCGQPGPTGQPIRGGVDLGAGRTLSQGWKPPEGSTSARHYVPIYSHVYHSDTALPFNLSATLSVRNPDASSPLVVESVAYHDSRGKLVREYLDAPVELPPLCSAEFYLRESDTAGGAGACFLVDSTSPAGGSPPVVEAVMIGTRNSQGISFVSEARPVPRPAPPG